MVVVAQEVVAQQVGEYQSGQRLLVVVAQQVGEHPPEQHLLVVVAQEIVAQQVEEYQSGQRLLVVVAKEDFGPAGRTLEVWQQHYWHRPLPCLIQRVTLQEQLAQQELLAQQKRLHL